MELEFRQAVPEDAEDAAVLLAATMGGYGIQTLGLGDKDKEIAALKAWFQEKGNRFNYEHTNLAIADGKVAGLLLSFGGNHLARLENGLTRRIFHIYSPLQVVRMGWRMFVLGRTHEADADEYLIAHLAVTPAQRKRGIGSFLLEKAELFAAQEGFSRLVLEVEIGNEPAERLYKKVGYTRSGTTSYGRKATKLNCPGYHKMLKEI